ncbi:MAG TPA: pyrroline-5-carboxylate reductase [Stellaceae bacterium]|nr:pyrroline-5-carboxylate reductase [Stellaceae bacterium]
MSATAVSLSTLLLIGCGRMGGALLSGWLDNDLAERYVVVEPAVGSRPKTLSPHVTFLESADHLDKGLTPAAAVIAVKPQVMAETLPRYRAMASRGTLFLSIAAGKTLSFLSDALGQNAALVRAMPNTPAAIGHGISVACANAGVDQTGRARADALLAAVGQVAWIEDEALMDAVTAVSGSGPAYVFLLIECLTKAGVEAGLPEPLAEKLARATVAGSGELARVSPESAAQLREAVTSPGGTTRAALDVLMAKNGLEKLMREAVLAAAKRSKELAG